MSMRRGFIPGNKVFPCGAEPQEHAQRWEQVVMCEANFQMGLSITHLEICVSSQVRSGWPRR